MKSINNFFNKELNIKLKNDGFVLVKGFLTKKEIEDVKKIVIKKCAIKGSPQNYFSINYRSFFVKLLKLRFEDFFTNLKIFNLTKNKKMKNIAENYFDSNCQLHGIDAYISKKTEEEILPWHTDKAYNGKSKLELNEKYHHPNDTLLKFFVYLTDVGPNDGCTSYLPKSHLIGKHIRNGIFKSHLKYSPYWKLDQFLDFMSIKENLNYLKDQIKNSNLIENLVQNIKKLKKNEMSEYDFFASAGDAIIFDEGGIHRGSKPSKSDRIIIRFYYKKI